MLCFWILNSPFFQEVKVPIQCNANSLAVFYEKLKTEIQEKQKQSLALACSRISQEQSWLFHCSLGSTSGTVLLHCCCQLQDLAGWGNQRQPSLAGCALCQPPFLVAFSPAVFLSALICRTELSSIDFRLSESPSLAHISPRTLHPQYFFLPCSQKVGTLPNKKQIENHSYKKIDSVNTFTAFSEVSWSLSWHFCRSYGNNVCHSPWALLWLPHNLLL